MNSPVNNGIYLDLPDKIFYFSLLFY